MLKFGFEALWVGDEEGQEDVAVNVRSQKILTNDTYQPRRKSARQSSVKTRNIPEDGLTVVTRGNIDGGVFRECCESTIGASFLSNSQVKINDRQVTSELWDTAGQERYHSMGAMYYRRANVVIAVCDLSDNDHANAVDLQARLDEARLNAGSDLLTTILLGNKSDLLHSPPLQVEKLARENNVFFDKVSAKTCHNLDTAFARFYSEAYLRARALGTPFETLKVVMVGRSGVGKTSLFHRLRGFGLDLSPLARKYPLRPTPERKNTRGERDPSPRKLRSRMMEKKYRVNRTLNNILSIPMGHLVRDLMVSDEAVATGDPMICNLCGAALSGTTRDVQVMKEGYDTVVRWKCEICNCKNVQLGSKKEIPMQKSVDYAMGGPVASSEDESVAVIVIDTSGSMGVSQEMPSNPILVGIKAKKQCAERKMMGLNDTFGNMAVAEFLHVSRLEAVQMALLHQLKAMARMHPKRRLALITFATDVTVHFKTADSNCAITFAGQVLDSVAEITQAFAKRIDTSAILPIGEAGSWLDEAILGMTETGKTALGPALKIAQLLCCSCISSSTETPNQQAASILLCTDGLSNVGVGRLDQITEDGEEGDAKTFLEQIGRACLNDSIKVDIMVFTENYSNVSHLGTVTSITGGKINRMMPQDIRKSIQEEVTVNGTVAMDVEVSVFLQSDVVLIDESGIGSELWTQQNFNGTRVMTRRLGSISSDSNVVMSFRLGPEARKRKSISFQVHVRFRRMDNGAKTLRVMSEELPTVASDYSKLELSANMDALALYAARSVAHRAERGDIVKARLENAANRAQLKRIGEAKDERAMQSFKNYLEHNEELDNVLRRKMLQRSQDVSRVNFRNAQELEGVTADSPTPTVGANNIFHAADEEKRSVLSWFAGFFSGRVKEVIEEEMSEEDDEGEDEDINEDAASRTLWQMKDIRLM